MTDEIRNDREPRYCTSHQGRSPAAGGVWLTKGGNRRWICANCRAARNTRKEQQEGKIS